MIKYVKPITFGEPQKDILELIEKNELQSEGQWTEKCREFLKQDTDAKQVILVPSGTSALELMAQVIELSDQDEIIAPAYTFSTTVSPFAERGAKIVFADICPISGTLDPEAVRQKITKSTRAIVNVSYAGGLPYQKEMKALCDEHNIIYLEDNAQAHGQIGWGKPIEPVAAMSILSFHYTKNIQCGEGGALLINDPSLIEMATNIKDKGTDRHKFLAGEVNKYQWVSFGSSHIMSELNAAYLYHQLQNQDVINKIRKDQWQMYASAFEGHSIDYLNSNNPDDHNGHIFAVITSSNDERCELKACLDSLDIQTTSHYENLATSIMGIDLGVTALLPQTDLLASHILRLPLGPHLGHQQISSVAAGVVGFYKKNETPRGNR